jgi:hypothetical protein
VTLSAPGGQVLFHPKWILAAALICACSAQQTATELSARDLFYREQSPDPQPQPGSSQTAPQAPAPQNHSSKPSTHKAPEKSSAPTAHSEPAGGGVQLAVEREEIPVGPVLGLRYNLILISGGRSEPADSDRIFQQGECIALEFEANSSGYIYVLEKGSSGAWSPLLPSAEMPDEPNVLKARTPVRVPGNYCFEISGPPGEERVFVALSRNPEDLYDLNQSIIKGAGGAVGSSLLAQNRLSDEVKRLESGLRDRDLKIKKIEKPENSSEPAHSVYVVNASTTSSNRVVAEIRIQHR